MEVIFNIQIPTFAIPLSHITTRTTKAGGSDSEPLTIRYQYWALHVINELVFARVERLGICSPLFALWLIRSQHSAAVMVAKCMRSTMVVEPDGQGRGLGVVVGALRGRRDGWRDMWRAEAGRWGEGWGLVHNCLACWLSSWIG